MVARVTLSGGFGAPQSLEGNVPWVFGSGQLFDHPTTVRQATHHLRAAHSTTRIVSRKLDLRRHEKVADSIDCLNDLHRHPAPRRIATRLSCLKSPPDSTRLHMHCCARLLTR
jgi:hypothetical protein